MEDIDIEDLGTSIDNEAVARDTLSRPARVGRHVKTSKPAASIQKGDAVSAAVPGTQAVWVKVMLSRLCEHANIVSSSIPMHTCQICTGSTMHTSHAGNNSSSTRMRAVQHGW